KAIGDSGKARGLFQMHRGSWEQISEQRASNGQTEYSWFEYSMDRDVSTEYAIAYLEWISSRLEIALNRKPLPWEIYASYNVGLSAFLKINCNFEKLPKHTQRACLKIAKLTQSSIPTL
ncbi:MAG: hypothetical protein EB160_09875, partial [Nitrososphaeria archaeon]|nr:hypothetical protein [Nitrososphaeria archaeon]